MRPIKNGILKKMDTNDEPISMLRLLVVIINYKTPRLVLDALESLVGEIDLECDCVMIVDNNSQDNSVNEINGFIKHKGWEEWASVISAEQNSGFSAGNNMGIQSIDAEYYLLLNSDAFVRQDAVKLLLSAAETNDRIGIVGPKLEWPNKEQQVSCFYNLSPINSFLQSAKTGVFTKFFKSFNVYEVSVPLKEHVSEQPEWLSFACVLLRGDMVKDIGLMDEGYFMYREDNDYCRRAIDAGWQLKFEPQAHVVHLNKGDSNQSSIKRLPDYYFKSRSRYFLKYYGRLGLFSANIFWSLGRCISLLREFVERKPQVFHPLMWKDIWKGFLMDINKK